MVLVFSNGTSIPITGFSYGKYDDNSISNSITKLINKTIPVSVVETSINLLDNIQSFIDTCNNLLTKENISRVNIISDNGKSSEYEFTVCSKCYLETDEPGFVWFIMQNERM